MTEKRRISRRKLIKAMGAGAAALAIGWPLTRLSTLGLGQTSDEPRHFAVGMRVREGVFEFDPVALRIRPGDTITWFQIVDLHSTTAYHPTNNNHQLRIPDDATPWDSGILGLDGKTFTFSRKFEGPDGVYDYYCTPHEFLGMVGRIIVGEAKPGPATQQPLPDLAQGIIPDVDVITGLAGPTFNGAGELNVPLLRLFQSDPEQAGKDVDSLIQAFAAGELQEGSLWQALETADQLDAYRRGLDEFAQLVRGGPAFPAALAKGDELKALLAQARESLIGS